MTVWGEPRGDSEDAEVSKVFKVRVWTRTTLSDEPIEHEMVAGYAVPTGVLWLEFLDGSVYGYANGTWREFSVEEMHE